MFLHDIARSVPNIAKVNLVSTFNVDWVMRQFLLEVMVENSVLSFIGQPMYNSGKGRFLLVSVPVKDLCSLCHSGLL